MPGCVFACDNTAVSGDEIILKKKHTKNFDIDAAMPEAFDRYKAGTLVLQRDIEALKAARLTPRRPSTLSLTSFGRGSSHCGSSIPSSATGTPRRPAVRPVPPGCSITAVRITKRLTPNGAMRATVRLGRFFGLGTPVIGEEHGADRESDQGQRHHCLRWRRHAFTGRVEHRHGGRRRIGGVDAQMRSV